MVLGLSHLPDFKIWEKIDSGGGLLGPIFQLKIVMLGV